MKSFDFITDGIPQGKVTICYWVISVLIDKRLFFVEDVFDNTFKLSASPLKALKIDDKEKAVKLSKLIMNWDCMKIRNPSGLFVHKVWTSMEVEDTIQIEE